LPPSSLPELRVLTGVVRLPLEVPDEAEREPLGRVLTGAVVCAGAVVPAEW
jgi:hypothetical protein